AETFPSMGWTEQLPHYLISRVAEHGRRRAAEMREVVETLEDVHLDPIMASATARAQDALVDRMEALGITYPVDQKFDWPSFVARVSKGERRKAEDEATRSRMMAAIWRAAAARGSPRRQIRPGVRTGVGLCIRTVNAASRGMACSDTMAAIFA